MKRLLAFTVVVAMLCLVESFTRMTHGFGRAVGMARHSLKNIAASRNGRADMKIMMTDVAETPVGASIPGNPVITRMDKENSVCVMEITLSGEVTQRAFTKACELFNEEVKSRGYTAAGFRKGSKLPPAYLYQMFGEDRVKMLTGNLMSDEIQDECEKTKLMFVGRGRITEFNVDNFTAGKPHTLTLECDMWPDISYGAGAGYKGLHATAVKVEHDDSKMHAVKKNIQERYKELVPCEESYAAQMGDVVVASMRGYEKSADGSKGAELDAVASGDSVEIVLEKGKFMEGLIEGLVGAKAGEKRTTTVKFPVRPSGPGAALSGKEAIFEIEVGVVNTKTLPVWDENLAARIRDGMTLAELEEEVKKAIDGDAESSEEISRNDGLAKALLAVTSMNRVPESLVEENAQQRFQKMLMDFKEQGSTDEQLQEMASEENYLRYKEISRESVNQIVTLGMAFRDIAEKEGIAVTVEEIKEQLDALNAQAKQRGEDPPDSRAASDEIMNVLLRRKVFNMLAKHATIVWEDPPVQEDAPAVQTLTE